MISTEKTGHEFHRLHEKRLAHDCAWFQSVPERFLGEQLSKKIRVIREIRGKSFRRGFFPQLPSETNCELGLSQDQKSCPSCYPVNFVVREPVPMIYEGSEETGCRYG